MRRIASIILIVLMSFSFFSFAYSAGEKINSKTTELNFYTGMFDFDEAEQSAGWMEELEKDEHTPETEEYGISSFVYRSRKPFDPKRFWEKIGKFKKSWRLFYHQNQEL